ncbi:MAG: mechanosensitive ion channel family protein [Bacteroidetes bacterium]|nr:mechanosensitive ion channel family protein [Bacteroidota bacterium]
MEELNKILVYVFIGNTIYQYCWFALILLIGVVFKKMFSKFSSKLLYKLFKKYSSDIQIEKFLEYLHKPTALFILLVFIYVAVSQLNYPESWKLAPDSVFGLKMIVEKLFLTLVISSMLWICIRIVDVFGFILLKRAEKTITKSDNHILPFMIEILKIVVIIIGVFVILGTVFNLNVGSLIAGLGIGGLAVALAAKETLENLIGSFTIFLDKPFTVGDLVKVGDAMGTIEKIGFRSTRLRTLEQSCITVPNKKMVDAELYNLSLMTKQKVKFKLSLRYDTKAEQINIVLEKIRLLLENHPLCCKDYVVRFSNLGTNAIEITIMYFVDTPDYYKYMQVREEINFSIIEIINLQKVAFAYNSTSVYIEK